MIGTIAGATVTMNGLLDIFWPPGRTDYWRTGGDPWAAYDALANVPGNNDPVALSDMGVSRTITFSKAVRNLYIATLSPTFRPTGPSMRPSP